MENFILDDGNFFCLDVDQSCVSMHFFRINVSNRGRCNFI